jgi:hypothetical protein
MYFSRATSTSILWLGMLTLYQLSYTRDTVFVSCQGNLSSRLHFKVAICCAWLMRGLTRSILSENRCINGSLGD